MHTAYNKGKTIELFLEYGSLMLIPYHTNLLNVNFHALTDDGNMLVVLIRIETCLTR